MYKVVFKGEIIEGQNIQQVKKRLAALHKVSLSKIEPLFSGNPITIKEHQDRNVAMNIKSAYEQAGAICTVEQDEQGHIPLDSPHVVCPKCGFEQPQATVCKKCGIIFAKYKHSPQPPSPQDMSQEPQKHRTKNRKKVLAQVIGKPARVSWGTAVPAFWGTTKLEVYPHRVIEQTSRGVSSHHSEILTSEIDSVAIDRKGNPVWLVLGFLTLSLFGLGIIFFILYFILKHKFLIIFSKNNSQVVAIVGDERPYLEFKDAVLLAAEAAKRGEI